MGRRIGVEDTANIVLTPVRLRRITHLPGTDGPFHASSSRKSNTSTNREPNTIDEGFKRLIRETAD